MRTYSKIVLRDLSPWWPPHIPGTVAPDRLKYEEPDCAITREDNAPVYDVLHRETGERGEIPCANVRVAVLTRAPVAAQPSQPEPFGTGQIRKNADGSDTVTLRRDPTKGGKRS